MKLHEILIKSNQIIDQHWSIDCFTLILKKKNEIYQTKTNKNTEQNQFYLYIYSIYSINIYTIVVVVISLLFRYFFFWKKIFSFFALFSLTSMVSIIIFCFVLFFCSNKINKNTLQNFMCVCMVFLEISYFLSFFFIHSFK